MKIATPFLYDLVHSLTKSEKRYVRVQAGAGEKDYLRLLDALLAQKTFDEASLVRDHEGANFLKHLAVSKGYLYELLLRLLTNYHQKRVESKIIAKIEAANILLDKGLFLAAQREIRKGQKLADKYEFFELRLLLSGLEKKLLAVPQFQRKEKGDVDQVFRHENYCLTQLKNTNEYWYRAQQIAQFQLRFQKIQTEEQSEQVGKITDTAQFQQLSLATNFRSKLYYYQANATYQFMLGNVERAYEINRSFLELLEDHPHFLRLYAERYIATLNNMLIDSLGIGKYDILEEGLSRLVMLLQRPAFKSIKNIAVRVFRQRYLLLLNWSLSQNDFESAMEWIPEIEKGLEQFGNKIEKHHRITFYYLMAYVLWHQQRYEQALRWNNLILADARENVVKEIFYFARILNVLIHYELGNHMLVQSLLQSTPKYLKKRRSLYATEKALFRFLAKDLSSIDKTEKQQLRTAFKAEIEQLSQQASEQRVFSYLDLKCWLKK